MLLPNDFEALARSGDLACSWEAFVASLDLPSPVSVHINDRLSASEIFGDMLAERVPHNAAGYYLKHRPKFTSDPLLHGGCYYVQEANSMALATYLEKYVARNAIALDMCAAPGGKSIIISQYLKACGFIVANEPMPKRANVLAENLQKWGNDNFMVTRAFPDELAKIKIAFDFILVDAPCSGEGMFRKEEEAVSQWSTSNVMQCAERQKEIVANAWNLLKDDGVMIYSTCTYNHFEDEDVVSWICDELGGVVAEQRHFYPHIDKGEGLFMAVIFKRQQASVSRQASVVKADFEHEPLHHSYSYCYAGERLVAIQKNFESVVNALRKCVSVVVSGTEVAQQKGRKYVPCHALALSKYRDEILSQIKDIHLEYNTVDLSLSMAMTYLRGDVLCELDCERGYVLLTYRDCAIGWGNNVANRVNNLYPHQWRVLSANYA